jgi:hypothetical protein
MEPKWGPETKKNWPTDRRSQNQLRTKVSCEDTAFLNGVESVGLERVLLRNQ